MQSGFQASDVEWDGVTCSQNKLNLLLDSPAQSLALNFSHPIAEDGNTRSLFVQAWIKVLMNSEVDITEGSQDKLILVQGMEDS